MDEKKNVWVLALEEPQVSPTDDIIPLMNEQCCALEEATEGAVKGRFIEIRLVPKNPSMSLDGAGLALKEISERIDGTYGTVEANALAQSDIGYLYTEKTYGFDIYSADYKYRPFEVTFGPFYPIKLSIDETIWRESREKFCDLLATGARGTSGTAVTVENSDMLMGFFNVIVQSRKMKFILWRLTEQNPS